MADKWVVGADGVGRYVPLTPEEIAQQQTDYNAHQTNAAAIVAEDTRLGTLKGDQQVVDWINKLAVSSNADIDAWFAANVTTAAQAINTLKAVVKVLSYKLSKQEKPL